MYKVYRKYAFPFFYGKMKTPPAGGGCLKLERNEIYEAQSIDSTICVEIAIAYLAKGLKLYANVKDTRITGGAGYKFYAVVAESIGAPYNFVHA